MIELKDYLHYYLNCRVKVANERYIDGGYIGTILGITETQLLVDTGSSDGWEDIKDCTPILRRLEDITVEEQIQFYDLRDKQHFGKDVNAVGKVMYWEQRMSNKEIWFTPLETHYLLSKGFDLFSLIENGLAIDKKTLNP